MKKKKMEEKKIKDKKKEKQKSLESILNLYERAYVSACNLQVTLCPNNVVHGGGYQNRENN